MAKSYLLVYSFSHGYVTSVVDYIHAKLKALSPFPVEFVVCDRVDAIRFDQGSIIFVLGLFEPFLRQPLCRYVCFNLERLYHSGPSTPGNAAAKRWSASKKQRFSRKVRQYDFVLDFHADQIEPVTAEFGISARVFPICVAPPAPRARIYEVCIVGSPTPRRVTIAKRLARLGVKLSPSSGIMGALIAGAALVTEPTPGVERYLPPHLYLVASYSDIVESTISLLGQPERLKTMTSAANAWLKEIYLPQCEATWRTLLDGLYQDHASLLASVIDQPSR